MEGQPDYNLNTFLIEYLTSPMHQTDDFNRAVKFILSINEYSLNLFLERIFISCS